MKGLFLILSTTLALFLAGCESVPYDYSGLETSKPRSILILPPRNESLTLNASYIFLSTISKPLAEKGYYVYPVAVIDMFLKENGLPTPAEMNNISLDKLRQHTGTDAVMYVTISEWGQNYNILSSKTIVSSTVKLIDTRTKALLWTSKIHLEQVSDNGGAGLTGALISAVVTQIAGSLSDRTPTLSSAANQNVINNKYYGLLDGPYKPDNPL